MATFEITSPQGQTYRIDGPEGGTEQQALQMLQRKLAGMSPPAEMSAGDQAADVAKSGGIGLVKGALSFPGALGDVRDLASRGISAAGEKLGASPESIDRFKGIAGTALRGALPMGMGAVAQSAPTSGDIRSAVESKTGKLYDPKTTAGQYAQTAGEFLGNPASYFGPGGLARKAGSAAVSALGSEAAGQAARNYGPEGLEPYARAAGAILAPAAGSRAITPIHASNPERAASAALLEREGVRDITAGQATGNRRLRYAESELGGSTAERLMERQGEQFTGAALRRIGENNATRATPEVIDQAFNRIGGQMNRLAAQNPLVMDSRVVHDLAHARNEYTNLVAPPMQAPVLQNVVDRITNSVGPSGIIPGRTYQAIRSDIGRYARAARADPNLQHALYEIQTALDANMERVIGRNNPNQAGAWRQARREYRNLLVIERAANYAGEAASSGIITPPNLARATKAVQQSRNYARGRGDFTPLARAGSEVLAALPNSGTAQRLRAHSIPALIAASIGGTAGSAAGPLGTAGGIAAGVVAPRLMGEAMLSRPGRAYLGNQIMPRDPAPLGTAAKKALVSQQADYGGPQ